MVQIPKALQECHWDIDETGKEPAYLLHRDDGTDTRIGRLLNQDPKQAEHQAAREARVEEARQALAMSPEELAELEKTDLYLARSVKDPQSRAQLELFLALPNEQMNQFLEAGETSLTYASAPERFRASANTLLQDARDELPSMSEAKHNTAKGVLDTIQGDLAHATIRYEDVDGGSRMRIVVYPKEGGRCGWGGEPALWPQYPENWIPDRWNRRLFLGSGAPDEKAADALAQEWKRRGDVVRQGEKQETRKATWQEPRNPRLRKEVTLPFAEAEPLEVEQFAAKETGLSIVADYFTGWERFPTPAEAKASLPMWRLLNVLSEQLGWKDWSEAGDCVVFRDRTWYRRALKECPESLLTAYREKLDKQGSFTLDDVAAFAVELDRRRLAIAKKVSAEVPRDLARAGLDDSASFRDGLFMYAALAPEQRDKARRPEGLTYAEMTREQRQLVKRAGRERRANGISQPAVSQQDVTKAVFRITQSHLSVTKPGLGDMLGAGEYATISLIIEFPNGYKTGSYVALKAASPATRGK